MTRLSDRGQPNQSSKAINRSKNLAVIDEIDELFQNNRQVIKSRRPSIASQKEAAESDGMAQSKQEKKELRLDTWPLTNPTKE